MVRGWLREAEPIAGVVAKDSFNSVELLLGLGDELYAFRFQLFISAATIICVKRARSKNALRHNSP